MSKDYYFKLTFDTAPNFPSGLGFLEIDAEFYVLRDGRKEYYKTLYFGRDRIETLPQIGEVTMIYYSTTYEVNPATAWDDAKYINNTLIKRNWPNDDYRTIYITSWRIRAPIDPVIQELSQYATITEYDDNRKLLKINNKYVCDINNKKIEQVATQKVQCFNGKEN